MRIGAKNLTVKNYLNLLKIPIIGMVLVSIVLFSVQSSFAYTVNYEIWDARILDIPTVCIIEPDYTNSEILTETFAGRLMDETRISVKEWMVQLQISERGRDKSMWAINQIPVLIEDQEGFDYDKCTVFIKFKEKPESKDEYYKLLGKTSYELGSTGRSDTSIYYAAIELCKTEDSKWIYFDPCYENYPRLMQQLQSVVKHEFGHALGLGHYVADALDVNVAWARGNVPSPSIMAVFSHQNINNNFITTKDVSAIKSIYGERGFLPPQKEQIVFESFAPSSCLYSLPKGGYIVGSVDGLLSQESYRSGVPVEITIKDPSGIVSTKKIFPNSDGVFSYETVITDETEKGSYVLYAEYGNAKSSEISFYISSYGENEQSKVPSWIKNSIKWWAEGKINDTDLILGIQFLIREGILNPQTYEDKTLKNDMGVKIPKNKIDSIILVLIQLRICPKVHHILWGIFKTVDKVTGGWINAQNIVFGGMQAIRYLKVSLDTKILPFE